MVGPAYSPCALSDARQRLQREAALAHHRRVGGRAQPIKL